MCTQYWGTSLVDVVQDPLQFGRLHHHTSRARTSPRLLQQPASSLKLSTFTFKFDGGQPDLLAVRVGLECQCQDGAGSWNVTLFGKGQRGEGG